MSNGRPAGSTAKIIIPLLVQGNCNTVRTEDIADGRTGKRHEEQTDQRKRNQRTDTLRWYCYCN